MSDQQKNPREERAGRHGVTGASNQPNSTAQLFNLEVKPR